MPILLILDSLALLALIWAAAVLSRKKNASSAKGLPVALPVAVAGLLLAGSVAVNAVVVVNGFGTGGVASFGARNSLQSRAQDWIAQRAKEPPQRDEVGRNIRIIGDGLAFLRPHYPQLPPQLRLQLEEVALLPTRITSVLTSAQEQKYFDGAQAVFEGIRALATQPAPER